MINLRSLTVPVATFATVVLAGCAGGNDATTTSADDQSRVAVTSAPAAEASVTIETFIFEPDPVTVPAGTTVVFENLDSTVHTVTAGTRDDPRPEVIDVRLEPDGTASWTFDQPGTYAYFCAVHSGPGMTGEVVVE